MRIPWFSKRASVTGTGTLVFHPRPPARANTGRFRSEPEYWRICEHCLAAAASVYCRTHVKFFCTDCIASHDHTGTCSLLSYEAARALARELLCGLR
jgi:hypothetical protein